MAALAGLIIMIAAVATGGDPEVADPTTGSATSTAPQPEPTTTSPSSVPSTPAPKPTETETSNPTEPAAPQPVKYSGSGNKILRIKKPSEGANLITLTHSGDANFIVDELDAELNEGENLVNAIGNYQGTTILDLAEGADTKRLKIQADGKWSIKIADLTDAKSLGSGTEGRGDQVLYYDGEAGVAKMTHQGEANFIVDFYNEDGGENLVNEIGKYSGESVIGSGPGLLKITADGRWTVKIEG